MKQTTRRIRFLSPAYFGSFFESLQEIAVKFFSGIRKSLEVVIMHNEYISDKDRLVQPMGQFQNWYGKLFYWHSDRLGWHYMKGCK